MEEEAIAALYAQHFDGMVRLAFVLTRSTAAAEDVTQSAFLSLYRKWDTVREPLAYLRVCVVNESRSWHRRRRRERTAAALASSVELAPPEVDHLMDALDALKERQRIAIILRFYGGLTIDEIAEALQKPSGTIKSDISRGLSKLKRIIPND